jgi:hypothetical protein
MSKYGVITSQKMPWLSKPKKSKVQVVNGIFEQASEITEDPFWKALLAKAALGKFPPGFSYRNGQLIYKRGTKVFKALIGNDPLEALTASLDFFREYGGIRSEADRERDELNARPTSSFLDLDWASLSKKKELKTLLIDSYIREEAKRLKLTNEQKLQLASMIKIGFLLGNLTNDDINYSRGKIESIGGLSRDEYGRYYLTKPAKIKRTTTKSKPKVGKPEFIAAWSKYLGALDKGIPQSTSVTNEDSEE